jgi:hypothetical protein
MSSAPCWRSWKPNKLKNCFFYCSWNCPIRGWEEFEVESRSVLSLFCVESHSKFIPFCVEYHSVLSPFHVEFHSEFSPFGVESFSVLSLFFVESHSEFGPFSVRSILSSVHSGLSSFGVGSLRGRVHSGLSPFRVESLRGWVHSGFSPIRCWVHSDKSPILGSVVLGSVSESFVWIWKLLVLRSYALLIMEKLKGTIWNIMIGRGLCPNPLPWIHLPCPGGCTPPPPPTNHSRISVSPYSLYLTNLYNSSGNTPAYVSMVPEIYLFGFFSSPFM